MSERSTEAAVARIEATVENLEAKLDSHETRMEKKFEELEARLEKKFSSVDQTLTHLSRLGLAAQVVIGMFVTLGGFIGWALAQWKALRGS